jgi:hypothetical protein
MTRALTLLVLVGLAGAPACGRQALHYTPTTPLEDQAMDITVSVYSVERRELLAELPLATEGDLLIDVDDPLATEDPPTYYTLARAPGFYTGLRTCERGDTISVDLDRVPDVPGQLTGVVLSWPTVGAPCYLAAATGELLADDDRGADLTTDLLGRYGAAGLDPGGYTLRFDVDGMSQTFALAATTGTTYSDLDFFEADVARAPNLYLYAPAPTAVHVGLGFPSGGEVLVSDPPYGEAGWSVTAHPDGWIDGHLGYLFYEATVPGNFQTAEGWSLPGDDLDAAFRDRLEALGLQGREVDDFVDHWTPRLAGAAAVEVYPQDADTRVTLDLTPRPDTLRRIWLLVRPVSRARMLPAPAPLAPLRREGLVAVEWGVILAGE